MRAQGIQSRLHLLSRERGNNLLAIVDLQRPVSALLALRGSENIRPALNGGFGGVNVLLTVHLRLLWFGLAPV